MWQGNKNNPVPTNNNVEKNNPIVSNVKNIALDTRRDEDPKKNFTVTLLDVDTALISYLQNVINPTVIDGGENIKVPIIYGNPEKWYAAKAQGGLRDQQGKLQIPLIMVKRTSFSKDEGYQTFNRYLTYPVLTKFNEKNKYDKFNLLNKTVAPTNQIFAVTMPDHIKAEYEFIVWTEYVEQNNSILEKINFAEGDYWGDKQRFNFRVKIDNYTNTIESSGEKDRMVRSTFTLTTHAYLLPESFEDRKQTVQRLLTPKQVKLTAEIVSGTEMSKINHKVKENTYSNKGNPYYSINPISDIDAEWRFPKGTIDTEESTTAAGQAITVIRQSYAAIIQQTITTASGSGGIVWHEPPVNPDDYGEEGWMAYDGDYHYIYVNGRWLRKSIAEWLGMQPLPSVTPTPTPTPTPTLTIDVTPSVTPSLTVTPSISVTPTITPSLTVTPTPTTTLPVSPTPTPTISPSLSITPSLTVTPTPSITPTITPTPSVSTTIDQIRSQLSTTLFTYDLSPDGVWIQVTSTEYENVLNNVTGVNYIGSSLGGVTFNGITTTSLDANAAEIFATNGYFSFNGSNFSFDADDLVIGLAFTLSTASLRTIRFGFIEATIPPIYPTFNSFISIGSDMLSAQSTTQYWIRKKANYLTMAWDSNYPAWVNAGGSSFSFRTNSGYNGYRILPSNVVDTQLIPNFQMLKTKTKSW